MGYRIEGDGSWWNTRIWKDGVLVDGWEMCVIYVNEHECIAYVDGNPELLSRVILLGVHRLVGDGSFENTRFFINDEFLRGVSLLELRISKSSSTIKLVVTFLPNIVEGEDNAV